MILFSAIIILACFIGVIILIITERLNRAIATLSGAIITYLTLVFLEGLDFSVIVNLLFGSQEDGYVNLHSIILIFSMMIVVIIAHEAGLFQFLALKLILLSKGKPIPLLIINCIITVIVSAVLNNILTVIILVPLTITISRIINVDPTPFILTQAVLVNIGGTLFAFSSIPNILIVSYAKITFSEFFLNVGLISIVVFIFTIPFFVFLYKDEIKISEGSSKVLMEFNAWNLVQNKTLLYESVISFFILITLFMIIPPSIISPDIIALTISVILVIVSRLNPKDIIDKIDYELIIYLLGIFVIAGGLEIVGITNLLGNYISILSGDDLFTHTIIILWFSAFLSSSIDNIPITKVLIPVIGGAYKDTPSQNSKLIFYSLAIGANWGDNLTPLGDNILVMNIAEQNKRPISFKKFFKLGFITTIYQLSIVTIIFTLLFHWYFGLMVILIISFLLLITGLISKSGPRILKIKIKNSIRTIREIIIR
ncbi:MAG: hypothetical protein GF353_26690 [Candidatus Lokiarchaeota archaeon]|nr:hypothetical protein [Candidatus Lokiarchaeota archaeon]